MNLQKEKTLIGLSAGAHVKQTTLSVNAVNFQKNKETTKMKEDQYILMIKETNTGKQNTKKNAEENITKLEEMKKLENIFQRGKKF